VLWNTAIDEVMGTEDPMGVTGVKLKNVDHRARPERAERVDGVFIAIGHAPASQLFKGQLETHEGLQRLSDRQAGHGLTDDRGRVYAAGDVSDETSIRQAVTAAGHGLHGGAGGRPLPGRRGPSQGQPPDQPRRGGEDRGLVTAALRGR
jgi:thioredoxin reductase (NADPH)